MKRMHILYAVIFILFIIIFGTALYVHARKNEDKFSPPEVNLSKLEKGKLIPSSKKKVLGIVVNPAKNFWQIYNKGVPVGDSFEDYAQALLCLPSEKGKCQIPPADMFESFQTAQAGPYKFQVTDNFEFEFIISLTFGGTFNLNGKNFGKYISRFAVLVPHYNKIRQNELSVVCKIEKVLVEGDVAVIEAVLWASVEDLEKRALISVKGNGSVKVIF